MREQPADVVVVDADVLAQPPCNAKVYAERGMAEFRPRFVPFVRTIVSLGPSPIRDLARAVGVTHSAASQTVTHMSRQGLVTLEPGEDARQRIVHLTSKALALLALQRRPLHERIAAHTRP